MVRGLLLWDRWLVPNFENLPIFEVDLRTAKLTKIKQVSKLQSCNAWSADKAPWWPSAANSSAATMHQWTISSLWPSHPHSAAASCLALFGSRAKMSWACLALVPNLELKRLGEIRILLNPCLQVIQEKKPVYFPFYWWFDKGRLYWL